VVRSLTSNGLTNGVPLDMRDVAESAMLAGDCPATLAQHAAHGASTRARATNGPTASKRRDVSRLSQVCATDPTQRRGRRDASHVQLEKLCGNHSLRKSGNGALAHAVSMDTVRSSPWLDLALPISHASLCSAASRYASGVLTPLLGGGGSGGWSVAGPVTLSISARIFCGVAPLSAATSRIVFSRSLTDSYSRFSDRIGEKYG
jgi:hypothetical protein